jgi:NADH-quinone oxidoreductase subunit E
MSHDVKQVAVPVIESFDFTPENLAKVRAVIAKYPAGRQASAVMPLLDLAQRQCGGWLPRVAMERVGDLLGMSYMRVFEVVTFYTMYKRAPVGKNLLQICTTTPCWLRGSDAVVAACRQKLGIDFGQTTADGLFTMEEVECLGACVNAPVVQINDDYIEDLDGERMLAVLEALERGDAVAAGSQIGRQGSMAAGDLPAVVAPTKPPAKIPAKTAATKTPTTKTPAAKKPVAASAKKPKDS